MLSNKLIDIFLLKLVQEAIYNMPSLATEHIPVVSKEYHSRTNISLGTLIKPDSKSLRIILMLYKIVLNNKEIIHLAE